MCLLIAQKKGVKVSNKKLGNAWNKNDDGVGYAFIKNGEIEINKFMEFKPFKKQFNSDVKMYGNESPFLIHFRYATHGITNELNVHPFKVNNNLVFGHNGVIHSVDDDKKLSDTQVFNNIVLKNLEDGFLKNEGIRLLISNAIGSSKLAFLDSTGNINIINENLGHWSDDKKIWYSNDGYKSNKMRFISAGNYNGYNANWNHGAYSGITQKTHDNIKKKCDICWQYQSGIVKVVNTNICPECSIPA